MKWRVEGKKNRPMLAEMEKVKGAQGNQSNQYQKEVRSDDPTTQLKTLAQLGISKQQRKAGPQRKSKK
jgi:hypothetical protein